VTGQSSSLAALALTDPEQEVVTVLLANHGRSSADPAVPLVNATVAISGFRRGAKGCTAVVRRIDADHTNPQAAWDGMGSPAYPSLAQVSALKAASEMTASRVPCAMVDGANGPRAAVHALVVPPHGVLAIAVSAA
jgi:hypothetical protein